MVEVGKVSREDARAGLVLCWLKRGKGGREVGGVECGNARRDPESLPLMVIVALGVWGFLPAIVQATCDRSSV
jgi:hypothetical protein